MQSVKNLARIWLQTYKNSKVQTERHNIDIQLTEIYEHYYEQVANRTIKDEDQLLIIANSLIKHKFLDQSGKFYVVVENDNHDEIIDVEYQEFDSVPLVKHVLIRSHFLKFLIDEVR